MFRNILERWLDEESRAPRAARRKAAPNRFRPLLQCLEDRLAPAVIAVTTTADVVANDGQTSLREAINQANATASEDTINLPAGVYEIAIAGIGEDANATGDFDITNPVIIKGADAAATIIDGNLLDRVFDAILTANATFKKVTVQNGFLTSGDGGGIRADDGDLTIKKSVVTGNFAANGGGINSEDGNVLIKDSTVSDNIAESSNGGGIDVEGPGDLTLINSTVTQNVADSNGGGIHTSTGAAVTLTDSIVSGNVAFVGGGISSASDVTLTNSTVSDNVATADGGGIESAGTGTTVTLTNSTVSGNVADGDTGEGGGINTSSAAVVLTNSAVSGNRAGLGGGIQSDSGNVSLDQSTVSGNVAGRHGGGIETASGDVTVNFSSIRGNRAKSQDGGGIRTGVGGDIVVSSSTIRGNTADQDGGGIRSGANVTLTNSTLSGNRAGDEGGGLFLNITGKAELTNVTISGNLAARTGGGIYNEGNTSLLNVTVTRNAAIFAGGVYANSGGTVKVVNTIIAQNLAIGAAEGPDVNGAFASIGHNLIGVGDGSTGFTDGVLDDQVGKGEGPINARLSPLANNGGPTFTHALKNGSLAIDAGDNASAPLIDQRGIARPRDGDGNGSLIVDIGAFER